VHYKPSVLSGRGKKLPQLNRAPVQTSGPIFNFDNIVWNRKPKSSIEKSTSFQPTPLLSASSTTQASSTSSSSLSGGPTNQNTPSFTIPFYTHVHKITSCAYNRIEGYRASDHRPVSSLTDLHLIISQKAELLRKKPGPKFFFFYFFFFILVVF
jgi:hypothetical protein